MTEVEDGRRKRICYGREWVEVEIELRWKRDLLKEERE